MLTTNGLDVSAIETELNNVMTEQLLSVGIDPTDKGERAALRDVYDSDPAIYSEDLATYRAGLLAQELENPTVETPTPTVSIEQTTIDHNKSAIADIVGMIRAKYTEEGERNFAIGKRFLEHARWQKSTFTSPYEKGDFESLARHVREEVRLYVTIKAESIRVTNWAKCHELRELVGKEISHEHASMLSMYEYLAISPDALKFSPLELSGELLPCWLDMVRGVVADRAKENGRVSREDFENRIVATKKRVSDARAMLIDPVKAAAKIGTDKVKADAKAIAKSILDTTTAIDTAISSGVMTPESVLATLEGVAKHHGKPLVSAAIGFDPATATILECEQAVDIMFTAGRLGEMKAMYARLAKRIATAEKALSARAAKSVKAEVMSEAMAA